MALSNEDQIIYLANVISVARADGVLSPRELDAIERIQKRVGARKSALNEATKLAETKDFQAQPVGHFADKVQNLEDLLYVSIVDGTVDNLEKRIILNFAKDIGVSKDQLNLILVDVKRLLASGAAQSKCPSCGGKIPLNAKFCAQCGSSIVDVDSKKAISVSYEIPKSGIAIEFAESTASGFVHAVESAKSAPTYATCMKNKKTWYLAAWPSIDILEAVRLVENLKGMRNRKVYVEGKESRWEEVFGFSWCAEARDQAYRPLEYCFGLDEKRLNIWGCKQARMDWSERADWFSYGSFRKAGLLKGQVTFVFDKDRIKHELQTNLFRYRYCPYLNFDLVQAVVDALPSEVTPSEKGPWGYKTDYNESPGSIKVKVKVVEDGYTYTDEFFSSGLAPKNPSLGLQILRQALDACGMNNTNYKGLLGFKGS